jgi:hypothetical protein
VATLKNYSFGGALPPTELLLVCEDLRTANGSFTFIASSAPPSAGGGGGVSSWPLTLPKRVYRNTVDHDDVYLGGKFTKEQVIGAPPT